MRALLVVAFVLGLGCASESSTTPADPSPDVLTQDVLTPDATIDDASPDADAPGDTAGGDVADGDASEVADGAPSADGVEDDTQSDALVPGDAACTEGATDCTSYQEQRRCTGGDWVVEACQGVQVCIGGACSDPVCEPNESKCVGTNRQICDSIGTGWIDVLCPTGFGCKAGKCERILPNVVVIVDTSGSMAYAADPATPCQMLPCAGFSFPICEDPTAPITRLGRTKSALAALFASPAATNVRLALQRFAQTGTSFDGCENGFYTDLDGMTGDSGDHEAAASWFKPHLHEIMAVPFDEVSGKSNIDALKKWVNFNESLVANTETCTYDEDCTDGICNLGHCKGHDDPELRAIGATPLGQSLYYAGEYLRQFILIEGRPCSADSDCATSPDHTCVNGACHDPFATCRPTAIVLFTDGEETSFPDKDDFFNPWVQAKRLHFGLGCTADVQCGSGATCVAGLCAPPTDKVPSSRCAMGLTPCNQDSDCPDYFCGDINAPCKGECTSASMPFDDPDGADFLKGENKLPIPITIHVADASGGFVDNAIIADWGGGKHVLVDFANAKSILDALSQLVDIKQGLSCE